MRIRSLLLALSTAVLLAVSVSTPALATTNPVQKLQVAQTVLKDFIQIPENAIPPSLLQQAYGIAIIPAVMKFGFILAGRHGSGVLAIRGKNGTWSHPAFITFSGGSIGFQAGLSSTDVILVFKSRRSVLNIANGSFTLGGSATVAAGPVGRSLSAATNARFTAEVYSYSRSRGLFAGVSLNGAVLSIDDKANATFYQQPGIRAKAILHNTSSNNLPPAGEAFVQTLQTYLPRPQSAAYAAPVTSANDLK